MPAQDKPAGVYIEEIPSGPITIAGVATSITAFVGRTPMGPGEPLSCQNFDRRNGASESQPLARSGGAGGGGPLPGHSCRSNGHRRERVSRN
jgi:phage tail sheath protein FI